MPKTGSTAIQRTLAFNRQVLSKQGFMYPMAATRGEAHHPLAWSARLDRVPMDGALPLLHTLRNLSEELEQQPGSAILSSEALFFLPKREIQPILDWAGRLARSTVAYVYVRTPTALVESRYRQRIQDSDYDRAFADHLTDTRVSLLPRLRTWSKASLIVRPYVREAFKDGDVVEDFCDTIGLDSSGFSTVETKRSNPSIDAALTEFKLRLNRSGVEHTPQLFRALLSWTIERPSSARSLYSPATWRDFVDRTAEDHTRIITEYGLPDDLRDTPPEEFTLEPMSDNLFNDLLSEFSDRYPDLGDEVRRAQ